MNNNWEREFDEQFNFRSDVLSGDGNYDGTTLRNDLTTFISSLLKQKADEILEVVEKAQEEYHGGGNGRRLLIQLEGEIKKLLQ